MRGQTRRRCTRSSRRLPAGPPLTIVARPATAYELSVESRTGTLFRIERLPSGVMDFDCAPAGTGGCDADGRW